jgi:cell division protein FtsB
MFATKKEYDSLKKIEVMLNDEIEKISDHNPIVAEFDL